MMLGLKGLRNLAEFHFVIVKNHSARQAINKNRGKRRGRQKKR